MKKKKLFYGSATALITPFDEDSVDYASLGRIIEDQIARHADAIVVCGSTGESAALTDRERAAIIDYTVQRTAGRIPVIAGTGAAGTARTLDLSRDACAAGADALLISAPTYCRPPQRGLIAHFRTIADAVERPLILYNIPSRTGCTLSHESYRALADHENIIGVKEAGAGAAEAARLVEELGDALTLYSGNDDMLLPFLAVGAAGVISVAGNLIPDRMHAICTAWQAGDHAVALRQAQAIAPLCRALFSDSNPIPVKTAMALRGFCSGTFRPPLCAMSHEGKARLTALLEEMDLLH